MNSNLSGRAGGSHVGAGRSAAAASSRGGTGAALRSAPAWGASFCASLFAGFTAVELARKSLSGRYFGRGVVAAGLLLGVFTTAHADADKSQFTLQNPTPRAQMREMSTDRPDTTESPISVDAGHWQLEMSFFDYATDGDSNTFVLAPFNLKLGLTNDVDVQLVVDPFINQERPHASGVGDLTIRVKYNLWGNDGGDTALALLPYLTFPTASGGVGVEALEGGLAVPFSMSLPDDWGLGLMAQLDIVRDEGDDHYTVNFLHSAVLGHDIVGDLAGYIEYFGIVPHNSGGGYQPYLSTGLTYGLSEDVQLDGGVRIGLSDSAEDFGIFTGISIRF